MDNILQLVDNFLGFSSPKLISPLPQNSPSFQNGQPAITPTPMPGQNAWQQTYKQQLASMSPEQQTTLYKHAVTSPGGHFFGATPTPPAGSGVPNIASQLAKIPNDPGAIYNNIIAKAAEESGVPAPLLKGVLAHESMQFNPKYVSGYHTDGSGRGVAAIDKNAHPEIPDEQAFDPSFAIPWAAKTIAGYKAQEGNWYQALQRYNGGGNYNSSAPGYAGVAISQRTHDYANNVLKQAEHFGSNDVNNNLSTAQTP